MWQVHLAIVRYHEGGRFCKKDEEWDCESAVFHLEHAADLGELEAIVGLGLMYSQLPHHILADVSLQVRGGRDLAKESAIILSTHRNFLSINVGPGMSVLAETGRIGPCRWGTSGS